MKEESTTYSLNLGGQIVQLDEPEVMGILNVTPDSFFAKSRKQSESEVAQRAEQIVSEGARFVDVGAYSTRPGATDVPEEEEVERLRMALATVRQVVPEALLSVDTFRASVVRRMAEEFGPFIVNDVTGGQDPNMFPLVAQLGLPYVLTNTEATALPLEFAQALHKLRQLGQCDIIADPGFGFGKTLDENYEVMHQLPAYQALELPLLVGVSRKSMIHRLLNITPDEALNGTSVLHVMALLAGANILRVHDVATAKEVIKIVRKCSSTSD